jgi:predicted anti-sigma-YlaC factor YlaD
MMCERWREGLSALADGEDPGVDLALLEAHVRRCPSCAAFRRDLEATRNRLRIREAVPQPDLSRRIAKLHAITYRSARWGLVRGLLAALAIEILTASAPELISGTGAGNSTHAARHLGAFGVAYAVGLLVVALRPARARTMIPVAAVLAVALTVSALIDVASGVANPVGELGHLPELGSVVLLWLLARPGRDARPGPSIALAPDAIGNEPDRAAG